MKTNHSLTLALLFLSTLLNAQEPVPTDVIGQQAAALEAELGKFKDTTPEAAESMFKLVELYHKDGRLFGLVRIAQQFVASHPADARHQAMMLRLIDGQESLSRNKELAATIRQFLARYPQAPECPQLEIRLADTQLQLDERVRSADACKAVWLRQGANEIGRRYGVTAVMQYSVVNSPEAVTQAATLGEEMLDKLPPGEFAKEVGWQAFNELRRIGQWAKSTVVGTKLLQKGLGGDPESQRYLHSLLAENYGNIGQHANAAQSLASTRYSRRSNFALLPYLSPLSRCCQAGRAQRHCARVRSEVSTTS